MIMIIDGKKLAEEIKTSLKSEIEKLGNPSTSSWQGKLRLAVVQVGNDPVTEKFLEQKKKFGNAVWIDVRVYEVPMDISTNALRAKISEIVHEEKNTAVIIQLPLPSQINTPYILDALTPEKDADMLSSKSIGLFASGRSKMLPPVVGAIKYIFEKHNVEIKGKKVVVVGAGRLIGKPVATWLTNNGATVTVCDEHTKDIKHFTRDADIIISGVGKPALITPDMIKDGAMVIDAGTSVCNPSTSSGRVLRGDCDPTVAEKALLFTPVPGGVGPLTVAMLFENVLDLAKTRH